ncbi:MAG: response regulator [Candidatus Methylomirabilia bacterium]
MEITEFVQPLQAVRVDASVYEIMESFHVHKDCSYVPIVNHFDEPLGIVREQTLRDFTFTMFGRDLLKQKHISEFLSPCPIVSYATRFDELIQTPTFQKRKEGFIIIKDGKYAGFLPLCSLLEMYEEHRLNTQQQLLQAHKMQAVGNLAGGIAHDFNNILAGITGHTELIRMKLVAPEKQVSSYLNTIETLSYRAADLTKQLLGFARGGKYQVQPLNVNEVVSHIVSIARPTFDRSIAIVEELHPALKIIEGDRGQLEQVLLNLLINARDAMPQGGNLTVKTWNLDPENETALNQLIGCFNGGIAVSVHDTGVGIPREIQERIFDPFFSTKEQGKGSGMGLAMVYGIVRNHNGQIVVRSDVGEGATFTLTFPSSSTPVNSSQKSLPAFQIGQELSQARIMVVDDDPHILFVVKEYLEMAGCSVETFGDGNQAVGYFQGKSHDIDIVLLDMIMPQISGQQVFHDLKRVNPQVKVLFLSGYNDSQTVQDLLAHDATGFLQKPFTYEKLLTTISGILTRETTFI